MIFPVGRAFDLGGGFFTHEGAGRAAVAGAAARGKKSSDMRGGILSAGAHGAAPVRGAQSGRRGRVEGLVQLVCWRERSVAKMPRTSTA
ncbi:hypothetical protein TPA0910_30380 [Streptomyces hygroscopicus subsp. sporocinereus]|uniref:Uncharacterized protein n=1 Tax=Streptomyces hygroscopicus TaxID=1912 RepID=A0ABQ3TZ01_STRHY|nr:hypothetical protein TPA0910_30380 [Streptomyces hygroscopicus]